MEFYFWLKLIKQIVWNFYIFSSTIYCTWKIAGKMIDWFRDHLR